MRSLAPRILNAGLGASDGIGGGDAQLPAGGRAPLPDDDVDIAAERGEQPAPCFPRFVKMTEFWTLRPFTTSDHPGHHGLSERLLSLIRFRGRCNYAAWSA